MKKKKVNHKIYVPGMSPNDEGDPAGAFVLTIEGLEASGKNELAFKAPGPIACFSVDPGTKRALSRARGVGKEIHVKKVDYEVPSFIPKQDRDYWEPKAKEVREKVLGPYLETWRAVAESEEFRTVVQDTSTDFWELHRLAHFGKLQQNPQLAYGPVNKEFMGTITGARTAGKLVILIHQIADEYKDVMDPRTQQMKSERTGRQKRIGHNKIGYLSDAIVRTHRVDPVLKRKGKEWEVDKEGGWEVEIVLNKADRSIEGMRLEDPGFEDLMALLAPNDDAGYWSE